MTSRWLNTVEGYGWGIIPIWSGPQAPCACWKTPCVPFPHIFSWDPATASTQGAQEADSATAAAVALGLPKSVVYVDIESYNSSATNPQNQNQTCGQAAQAYLDGWVGEMHLNGFSAGAGVYGSPADAQTDFSQISPLPDEVWIAKVPKSTPPSVTIWGLSPLCDQYSANPCALWSTDQRIHQYLENEKETWGGIAFGIDPDIVDAIVAYASAGTKTYNYSFTSFSPEDVPYTYGMSMNNIGAAPFYGGFINGSASDSSGEIGEILDFWYADFNGGSGNLIYNPSTLGTTYLSNYYNPAQCGGNYCYTDMQGINNAGWIVGTRKDSSGGFHGFLAQPASYQSGNFTSIDDPNAAAGNGYGTWATAINDAGLVTGYYTDSNDEEHGFLYSASTSQFVATTLDYPGSAGLTVPLGINGDAQIVGWYYDGASVQGFLYSSGNFTSISGSCGPTELESINDNGQIVGQYSFSNPLWADYFVSYDLGATCSVFSAFIPYGINDAGQITGFIGGNGTGNGVVAVPQTP